MKKFLLGVGILLLSGVANAAILNIDENGQLMGAADVIVDGSSYNVEFVDGTCIELFNGCDASYFTFTTEESARLASQALLDQVLIDSDEGLFDTTPYLTNGVEWNYGIVLTPYYVYGSGSMYVHFGGARNTGDEAGDMASTGYSYSGTTDFFGRLNNTVAMWTLTGSGVAPDPVGEASVPAPATLPLFALGLLGLLAARKRKTVLK